ncbi:MAG: adenine phosphoribosyltransferase, partial [Bacteroidaceae bacterium]|nr:adenine phosphoribosyltransferase [Bacteroidaceae bacterium]
HKDAIHDSDIVVLHDDLLATEGTIMAAYNLIKHFNPQKIYTNFIIELVDLNGRKVFPKDANIETILQF